jgi:hypothetical protein
MPACITPSWCVTRWRDSEPSNKGMKLTKLSAAWSPAWTCRLMPAPVNFGRGHRFAAYPRCCAPSRGERSGRNPGVETARGSRCQSTGCAAPESWRVGVVAFVRQRIELPGPTRPLRFLYRGRPQGGRLGVWVRVRQSASVLFPQTQGATQPCRPDGRTARRSTPYRVA